jgi:RNA polymerase-binding transcription factor DksA
MANNELECPIAQDELEKWHAVLLTKRQEITEEINGLIRDAIDVEDGHTTPTHNADRGSDADMQDISLGMVGNEEELLWQIDRALVKIEKSEPLPFGLCEHTQKPIPKKRLQLLPWTPLSVEAANYMDENGLTLTDMIIED